MGRQVIIDDIALSIPSRDRCWDFIIVYACGHPVTTRKACHVRDKVIRVKRDDHRGPCALRRCLRATTTHKLREQCHRCELLEARFEVNHPASSPP
ncbi:hypothetical protein F4823DRAFT_597323 [Ustulina deusta]|nr:hypothetical protein F4823DRAFT_597323 [Ustulina deusta]